MGELVGEYRLTTIVGPGGFGKTRLAVEASRALLDQMPDGVWLVELAAGTDLPAAVMAAMDLREQSPVGREKADDRVARLVGDAGGSVAAMAQAAREAEKVGWPDAVAAECLVCGGLVRSGEVYERA